VELQDQDRLHIQQKTSLTRHRYRIYADNGAGKPGELIAYVDQDLGSIKDKGIIYTGEDKSQVLAEFRARKLIDVSAAFDVFAPDGTMIGGYRKEFKKSLYRSAWTLDQEGAPPITVLERNPTLAVVRRAWTLLPTVGDFPFPMRYHFDLLRDDAVIGGVDRVGRLADNYLAWARDPKLDRRLLISLGVALDFRQGR
jgi:uncharacterized protein YxjI